MSDINPATGKRWRYGEMRADGKIFQSFGGGYPRFYSPESFRRNRVVDALRACRRRAEEAGLPFDLDVDYLLSIYPEDSLCPILGVPMAWAADSRDTCPSLDKIVPTKGYVKGNVAWLSMEANRIKQDASLEVLKRLVSYVESAGEINGS